ncbi:hypothetical protein BMG03_06295 [Thioclava nitratireducens]|uniref:RiboL-PSP-HEPN domain-containing protein n=1 Tax=Thioclava nitratireducens TaxID=1915078 RepID=A0ABM6IFJ5_9RHOB|nr:hypothetical protein [Thioclava nitratireducens]AQS47452.1 hypothetical protein BMG03_06295 [Thioclava nitratireducens]
MKAGQFQVQKELSDEYLLALGVYVQTCARIELWAARLISLTGGMKRGDPDFTTEVDELRTGHTPKLVDSLKQSLETLAAQGSSNHALLAISAQIDDHMKRRNAAVHGVHSSHEGWIVIDTGEKPKIGRPKALALDANTIRATVADAERILQLLRGFREQSG